MRFHCAQTFYLDKAALSNTDEAAISSVKLFFRSKPLPTGNMVGVDYPGVTISIVETEMGIPKVNSVISSAYLEYVNIWSSSDASLPTLFRFTTLPKIKTDREYAMLISFDRSAEYVLWSSKVGDWLVGSTTPSPGPSGKNVGNYFSFIAADPVVGLSDLDNARRMWRPNSDVDLKFEVSVARYRISGAVVSNVNTTKEIYHSSAIGTTVIQANNLFEMPMSRVELISFDLATSYKEPIVGSQMAYQETVPYPGGIYGTKTAITLSTQAGSDLVTAEATLPNGSAFSWNSIFSVPTTTERWIVFKDTSKINVRKVQAILSNTAIQLTEPLTFTNANATMMITPVGRISGFNKASPFGLSESFLILDNSSANSTCRFVNNSISSLAVSAGGNGYSNSDVVYVSGFENVPNKIVGGYQAVANVRTNANGSITALYLSNTGAGFVNSAAVSYTVGSPSSNTSAGTGATFVATVGTTIRTELRPNNRFAQANVCNIPISQILPNFDISIPNGTNVDMTLSTGYLRIDDPATIAGYRYQVDPTPTEYPLQMFLDTNIDRASGGVPVMISRSNEFVTTYANGSVQTDISPLFSKNIQLNLTFDANNDFVSPSVESKPRLSFSKYIINSDSTDEHTSFGAAWAKGIEKKIRFQRTSEDLLVYLTAYRPQGTDIEVYARMQNSLDPDAFDDKQWTRLTNRSNALRSSSVNTNDWVELTYGLPQYHQANNVIITGVATASNGSATISGIGTTFNTELAVNDLIRISPPLFPEIGMIAVVNSIANGTSLTLKTSVTNNSFFSTALNIEKIGRPLQAFNYIMNDNVARYYNSTMMEFDGYDQVQLKIVLLSGQPNKIPRVDDVRAVGVSA